MVIIPLRELKNNPSEVIENAQKEPIIITVNGRPKAILFKIKEGELETILSQYDPAIQNRIKKDIKKYIQSKEKEQVRVHIKRGD